MFGRILYFLIFLQVLTIVAALFCSDNNCRDCVTGSSCRWCKRDGECHMPGAILTNPCMRAENIVEKSHCDDVFSHYDPALSMKMLLLSAAAYDPIDPQGCLTNSLPTAKFQIQAVVTRICDFDNNECSGFVAVSHVLKAIVIAFRGSTGFGQAFKQFLEVLTTPKTAFLGGEVQHYWKRGFEQLWNCMEAEVKALVSKNPSYQVWVTGHSLGGAMASIASTWLRYYNVVPRRNIILYTFGMPRVGNYDYAFQHDKLVNNSWRVVNNNDLVPHFPTVISLSILNGPYHHGVEAFYSEVATSPNSPHKECHGKPYNEDATCSASILKPTFSIDDHETYFSIRVGHFWETKCLSSTRGKRDSTENSQASSKRFQFKSGSCSKYKYKNNAYTVSAAKESRSASSRFKIFKGSLYVIIAFLIRFIGTKV